MRPLVSLVLLVFSHEDGCAMNNAQVHQISAQSGNQRLSY